MEIKFRDGSTQEIDLNDLAAIKSAMTVLFAPKEEDFVVLHGLMANLERCATLAERKRIRDLKAILKGYNKENQILRMREAIVEKF